MLQHRSIVKCQSLTSPPDSLVAYHGRTKLIHSIIKALSLNIDGAAITSIPHIFKSLS